jgi:protocatechuate 3,4-dioxygenase beta subunit
MGRVMSKGAFQRGSRLQRDLLQLQAQRLARRRVLGWLAGGTVAAALGGRTAFAASPAMTCTVAPEETNGPFPADGSRAPFGRTLNVLQQSGIVRRDITASFGSSQTVAAGVPLMLTLTLEQSSHGCAALQGHAVYLWQCDHNGEYSLYAPRIAHENYLRGVQVTDAAGQVTFQTIFPACYSGRYPHMHLEVYPSLATASQQSSALLTTQLALPRDTCARVYANGGYHGSLSNLADLMVSNDPVFAESTAAQIAAQTLAVQGSVKEGLVAAAVVAVR